MQHNILACQPLAGSVGWGEHPQHYAICCYLIPWERKSFTKSWSVQLPTQFGPNSAHMCVSVSHIIVPYYITGGIVVSRKSPLPTSKGLTQEDALTMDSSCIASKPAMPNTGSHIPLLGPGTWEGSQGDASRTMRRDSHQTAASCSSLKCRFN